jgi:membrane protein implicated in regulation of membrane protease activity
VSAAVAAQIAATVPALSDTGFLWLQVVMVAGIALTLVATLLTARANKRLDERIRRRREQRRARAQAAAANIDALAGRPPEPTPPESQDLRS